MNTLIILEGPAYGDERAHNGLRLAANLAKWDGVTDAMLVPDARRSSPDEVGDWTIWAERTLTF